MAASSIDWGSVADWVSGIGSLSAVVTALYLSHSSNRIRLRATCGHRALVGSGYESQDLILFTVTNVGTRATKVVSITMEVGFFRPQSAIVMLFKPDNYGPGLPKALDDGEQAHWGIELDGRKTWIKKICEGFVRSEWDVRSLRFLIHTSNSGRPTKIRPEAPVRQMMRDYLRSLQK